MTFSVDVTRVYVYNVSLLNGSEHKHKPVGHLNGVQRREALLLAHSQSFHWSAPASCLCYRPAVLLCTSAPNPLTV